VPGAVPRSVHLVLLPVSSQKATASRQKEHARHTEQSLPCSFHRRAISRLHPFSHVQAPMLARPPSCTYRCDSSQGSRAVYATHRPEWLPIPGCGITTRPIRATDAAGLSPARLQPCRLLILPRSSIVSRDSKNPVFRRESDAGAAAGPSSPPRNNRILSHSSVARPGRLPNHRRNTPSAGPHRNEYCTPP